MHRCFFYGTLRKGSQTVAGLYQSNMVLPVAHLVGFELYDLGPFPGVVPGKGTVIGEVHEIDETVLREMDRYEGYNVNKPATSLFCRELAEAVAPDGTTTPVWVYLFNNPRQSPLKQPVASGDWFEHKGLY